MKQVIKICLFMIILTSVAVSQPQLRVKPSPLYFGYISIGGINQREMLFINIGFWPVVIDSCLYQAPFYVENISGITINPGDTLTVETCFSPEIETDYLSFYDIYYTGHFGQFIFRLRVTATGIQTFEAGEIIWSYQHIENVVCVAAAGDYNNDGLPDVVAEGYFRGVDGDPLVCLSGSNCGSAGVVWSVHPEGGSSNSGGFGDQCIAYVDDLNGDGYGDIVRAGAWECRTIFAIDGLSGATIWSYDTYQNGPSAWIYSVAQINDINGDSIPEVLAGLGSDANRAYCLDGATGERLWLRAADDGVGSVASIDDVNGDGFDDAVFSTIDYGEHVYCVSGASEDTGDLIWSHNIGNNAYSLSIIADINNDGFQDIIVGTWGSGLVALSGYSDDEEGALIWQYPMNSYIMRVVSCPDLDDDGYEDILVASWSNYTLAISGADGSEIWRYDCGDEVWTIDFTEDITGDSIIEVVAGSLNSNVYMIDGAAGSQIWQCNVSCEPFSIRGIGDVNGDGYADVIAGTRMVDDTGGEVFLISGGPPEPIFIAETSVAVPANFIATTNYPNPFNSSALIKFGLDQASAYILSIYDITGRLVCKTEGYGHTGINTARWSPAGKNEIVSGIYIYLLKAGTKTGKGKMTYLK